MTLVSNILNFPAQMLDPVARIVKNTDQLNQVAKLALAGIDAVNLHVQQPVLELARLAIKNVTDFVGSRQVFSTANELVSGEAANKNPISDSMPNILRVASRGFVLVDNVCKTVSWLGSVGILNAADIASKVASIPVFGLVGSLTLKSLGAYAGVVGWSLDLIDIARVIATKGFTVDSCLVIAGDVAKIFLSVITVTFAGAAPYTILLLGIVAASTASISSLTKFLIGEYYPRVNNQLAALVPSNNQQGGAQAVIIASDSNTAPAPTSSERSSLRQSTQDALHVIEATAEAFERADATAVGGVSSSTESSAPATSTSIVNVD